MIDELKLIIEMLGGIQEDAYTLVVAYFSFMLFKWVATAAAVIYFLNMIFTSILGIIRGGILSFQLRDLLQTHHTGKSYISSTDKALLIAVINKHKEKK